MKYQNQINRFKTNIINVDEMVEQIKEFLDRLFSEEVEGPSHGYNAISFTIEEIFELEINICHIRPNYEKNLAVFLKLRRIGISPKYRNRGYCTSIINFLEEISSRYKYDGIEVETVTSESMFRVLKRLNYTKMGDITFSEKPYVDNYRKYH